MANIQLPEGLQEREQLLLETVRTLHPRRVEQVLDFARWLQTQPVPEKFQEEEAGEKPVEGETLADFLAGYVGTLSGTTEALSENCGQRFAQGLMEKQQRGHL